MLRGARQWRLQALEPAAPLAAWSCTALLGAALDPPAHFYTAVQAQKRLPLVARSGDGSSGEEVKRVHAYGKQWALAPDDYETVVFKSAFLATLRSLLPSWLGGRKAS